jgi:hypothetical protein
VALPSKPPTRSGDVASPSDDASPLSADLAAVKTAIDLARKAKTSDATAIEKTIGDPAARKLVEWFILHHPDADTNFSRYAAFIADDPGWPSMGLMRKHRARMDKRIGAKDLSGAKRAAQRLGSDQLAIVKACAAANADKALDLLNAVATDARNDLGYTLCRIRWTSISCAAGSPCATAMIRRLRGGRDLPGRCQGIRLNG